MAGGAVKSHKPKAAPEWVFRWRASKTPQFQKLLALAIAGVAFAFLITKVRIRVRAPEKSSPQKASLIYLREDAQGRALTLRAREGGPFPSRFELAQWQGLAELESAALEATRVQVPPYIPALRELPVANRVTPLDLAAKGELFFPRHSPLVVNAPDSPPLKPAPVLYPLSGVSPDTLPVDLPHFDAAVDGTMASASWRFLVRLNPSGGVAECVSLGKGGEPGAAELDAWLHRIQFKPEPEKPFRWIAVGIGFTNQPADGTHTR